VAEGAFLAVHDVKILAIEKRRVKFVSFDEAFFGPGVLEAGVSPPSVIASALSQSRYVTI